MSTKRTVAGLWVATLLLLTPLSVMAHSDHKGGHGRKACKADVQQFCSQTEPGEGRIFACLKQHQSQLQPLCQEKLPKWEKFQQMKQTCQADREKFCPQAKRGEVRACMKENHDLLSAQCRTAIDEIKAWKKSPPPSSNQPAKPSGPGTSATHWGRLRSAVS